MVITLATFTAQANQAGAPSPYILDNLISDYYDVSVVAGWTTPSAPTSLRIYLWRKLGGKDTVGTIITLIGQNEEGQVVSLVTGESTTVRLPGHCGYIGATVVMSGGSSPTFTGTIIADGNFSESDLI